MPKRVGTVVLSLLLIVLFVGLISSVAQAQILPSADILAVYTSEESPRRLLLLKRDYTFFFAETARWEYQDKLYWWYSFPSQRYEVEDRVYWEKGKEQGRLIYLPGGDTGERFSGEDVNHIIIRKDGEIITTNQVTEDNYVFEREKDTRLITEKPGRLWSKYSNSEGNFIEFREDGTYIRSYAVGHWGILLDFLITIPTVHTGDHIDYRHELGWKNIHKIEGDKLLWSYASLPWYFGEGNRSRVFVGTEPGCKLLQVNWDSPNSLIEKFKQMNKFHPAEKDKSPPTGALVFFSGLGEIKEAGYMGLYVGDGRVIHGFRSPVVIGRVQFGPSLWIDSIDKVEEDKWFVGSYLGWAYPLESGAFATLQPPVLSIPEQKLESAGSTPPVVIEPDFKSIYSEDPGLDSEGVFEVISIAEISKSFIEELGDDIAGPIFEGIRNITLEPLTGRIIIYVKNGPDISTKNKRAYIFSYKADRISIKDWVDYLASIKVKYGPIGRLTIYAHGNVGKLFLLKDPLSKEKLKDDTIRTQLQRLRKENILTSDAHILLFTCLTGQDEDFIQELANITGAWVHANKERSGYTDLFGLFSPTDWKLEVVKGPPTITQPPILTSSILGKWVPEDDRKVEGIHSSTLEFREDGTLISTMVTSGKWEVKGSDQVVLSHDPQFFPGSPVTETYQIEGDALRDSSGNVLMKDKDTQLIKQTIRGRIWNRYIIDIEGTKREVNLRNEGTFLSTLYISQKWKIDGNVVKVYTLEGKESPWIYEIKGEKIEVKLKDAPADMHFVPYVRASQ